MVLGGIFCPSHRERELRQTLVQLRVDCNLGAEMKWKKINPKFLERYKYYAQIFFKSPFLSYNCIVVDKHLYRSSGYVKGRDFIADFMKLVVTRNIRPQFNYRIKVDAGLLPSYKELILRSNKWLEAKHGRKPIEWISPINSKNDDLIQMSDLLCGAVHQWYEQKATNPAKRDFASCVWNCSGLGSSTVRSYSNFNRWYWKLRTPVAVEQTSAHKILEVSDWYSVTDTDIQEGTGIEKAA
mgnify:CR=1 FL=1